MENLLSTGNSCPAWEGIKNMMEMQTKHATSLKGKNNLDISNELIFLKIIVLMSMILVRRCLFLEMLILSLNIIKCLLIKTCCWNSSVLSKVGVLHLMVSEVRFWITAIQLADLFHFIFQLFLLLHRVHCPWKDSIIVSVPMIKIPKSLSDFRSVATNLVIKTLKVSKGCTLGHGTG